MCSSTGHPHREPFARRLKMAVPSLARFMPADYQREAAKRIIEVYEQWLQSEKDAKGSGLSSGSFGPHSVALRGPITDAEFTEVTRDPANV